MIKPISRAEILMTPICQNVGGLMGAGRAGSGMQHRNQQLHTLKQNIKALSSWNSQNHYKKLGVTYIILCNRNECLVYSQLKQGN